MPASSTFELNDLSGLLAVLIALSVATERLVSIIKNLLPWLSIERTNALEERVRNAIIQLLSVGAGIATAALANSGNVLPAQYKSIWVLLGLLASGGSSFWTSILGYVSSVKDIKKSVALDTKVQVAANITAVANGFASRPTNALDSLDQQPTGNVRTNQPHKQDRTIPSDTTTANAANNRLYAIIKASMEKV